ELKHEHLTNGFTLSLLMGAFFAGLLMILAPVMEFFFHMPGLVPVLRAIAIVFFVDSITIIGQGLLQRNMKFKILAIVEVASYAIGYGAVGITLGYYGFGIWALVIANISQAFLQAVLIMIVQPFPKRIAFQLKTMKHLLHFGGGFTIARIGNFLAVQGDNLVVGKTLGAAALGLYGRAYQFMVMPSTLFGHALDRTLFPAMARIQDDKQRLIKAYLTGSGLIALIAIPISMLFILLAPEIILLFLGKNWEGVIMPFRILACSLLFRMSYKMSDSLARATGAVYRRAWRQLIYAASVFIGSYIGHFWGISGVACGVAVSLLINFILMAELSIQLTGTGWKDILKSQWHGMLLGIITGVVTYLLATFFRQFSNSYILIISGTFLGVCVVLFLFIWIYPQRFIRDDQKALFQTLILKRFKKQLTQAA
ncbi:MAG TPA: lipopolysaccharide biosynthesis protein, partial [Flavitalea sp.]|nr:lipopolysaccharide biosynthesis protein [Flavitalea sp.]